MDKNKQPIKLLPAFKDYLWGGTRLKTEFNKKSELEKVAESWELSTHKDGESIVASGEYKGKKLSEYIAENPYDVLGERARAFDFFPVLIKFIDAKDNLSVQVHPDDEYARKYNGEYGKTEMWYVLECDEGAQLYYGFKEKISKEEFRKRIENNTLTEVLNSVKVKKGDVYFIEAGTVHAIGKGIVICEIQQNSNTTFRVYDYNRKDANGNTRQLHIEQAIEVAKTEPAKPYKSDRENVLASCKYFTVEKADVDGTKSFEISDNCFKSVIAVEGSGILKLNGFETTFGKGDSIFIPAQNGGFTVNGCCELIITYV